MQSSATSYKQDFSSFGIVDSSANCSIIFNTPPAGLYFTGSITVYDSLPTTDWLLKINGTTVDKISGACTSQGIQVSHGDVLTVNAVGLQGTTGTTYHATFSVIVSPEGSTNLVTPSHDTLVLPSLAPTNLGIFQFSILNGGTGSTGVIDVTKYSELMIEIQSLAGPNTYILSYYNDSAGTLPIPLPTPIWYNQSGNTVNMFVAPNGPYLNVSIENASGGTEAYTARILGLAAAVDRSLIVPVSILSTFQNTFAGNGVVSQNMPNQSNGTAELFILANSGAFAVDLDMWNGTAWMTYAGLSETAAARDAREVILPFSDTRITLQNQDGGANTVTGVVTGVK